jgi:hypothetical protein
MKWPFALDRETILNRESGTRLMDRWTLLRTPWGNLCVHVFHTSDEGRDLHDHPWAFTSLILFGGYTEVRPKQWLRDAHTIAELKNVWEGVGPKTVQTLMALEMNWERVFIGPLTLVRRPASWVHRVELAPCTKAVTILWRTRKTRPWGFFTIRGWVFWEAYVSTEYQR